MIMGMFPTALTKIRKGGFEEACFQAGCRDIRLHYQGTAKRGLGQIEEGCSLCKEIRYPEEE